MIYFIVIVKRKKENNKEEIKRKDKLRRLNRVLI